MAKKPVVMEGQLTLQDGMRIIDELLKSVNKIVKEKTLIKELSVDDYLAKGERIESLAKEAFSKEMAGLKLSDFEKKLFGEEIPDDWYLDSIVELLTKKILNPMLRSTTDYSEESEIMRFLKSFIDFDFKLNVADESYNYFASYMTLKRKWKRSKDQLVLTISDGDEHFLLFGYRGQNIPKNMRQRIWKDGARDEMFGNIGETLTWMIIVTQYCRLLSDKDKRDIVEKTLSESVLLPKYILSEGVDRMSCTGGLIKDENGSIVPFEERFMSIDRRCNLVIDENDPPCPDAVEDFLSYTGISQSFLVTSEVAFPYAKEITYDYIRRTNRRVAAETKGMRPCAYILRKDLENVMTWLSPVKAFEHGYGKPRFLRLFSTSNGQKMSTISLRYLEPAVCSIVKLVWAQKRSVISSYNYYHALSGGEHARSFENKKQSVQKYIRAAKESELNKRFGFIEFDNDVDLDKVSVVAQQIMAFVDGYLNKLDLGGVALRFRKLGNHKASGLYYPGHRCICVDIHSPSSFVHELGHCIDHITSDDTTPLSESSDFYQLWKKYCYLLDRSYYELTSDAKKLLSGASKYNMSYYKIKTEAFARCFEIYVVRMLGFDNSICKQQESSAFAYPDDESFNAMVKEYFDMLLAKLHDDALDESLNTKVEAA